MPDEAIGERYRLEERIATGGMAEVWAAHDPELDRRVALKLLQRSADPARFAREARAAAALSHPNICRLYDYGETDGRPYIVLEYLPGGTLADRLAPGEPLPDDDAARLAREIASGLAHAHAHGLVHRDVKPGNVLFDPEGGAKITDFGIAQIGGVSTLTEPGTLLGTAAYISPEQAKGEGATPASDVYSFGVVLYQILTGRLPFEAEAPLELAAMHANQEPPPIRSLRPDAPSSLERVATAALAKRPEDRPADGSALLAALEEGTRVDETTAVIGSPHAPQARPAAIRGRPVARWLAAGAALVALSAGGVAAALLAGQDGSNGPAREPQTGSEVKGAATEGTTATTARAEEADATRRRTTREQPPSRPGPPPAPETSATTAPAATATTQTPVPEPPIPPEVPETPTLPLPTTGETSLPPPTTDVPPVP